MKISIVVPTYNEGSTVKHAYHTIKDILVGQLSDLEYEIIFVDDGSSDDTFEHISELCNNFEDVKAIKLIKNYGSHMAIRAGLERSEGDIACFLACDLQDPPSIIPLMLKELKYPVQIVWAVRKNRKDPFFNKISSKVFFQLARHIVSENIPPNGASMFLLGKKPLNSVRLYKEQNLTLEGLFATMGFQQSFIFYERQKRISGKSKWNLAKKIKLFIDFFVGYSYTAIRYMSFLGISVALLGLLYASFIIIKRIFYSTPIEGWSSIMVAVLFIGGLQMIMIGVLGEYLWRTLDESRGRPRYLIDKLINFNN